MKRLKTLLLVMSPFLVKAQPNVYNGNLQLSTQTAVDTFASQYTVITGKLQVYGPAIKNLSALSRIDTVRSKLEILTTDSLRSLDGLNVKYVGNNVYLEGNKKLRSISALQTLRYIGKDLIILDCDSLKSLHGLGNVDSIKGNLYIGTQSWTTPVVAKSNDSLDNLCALSPVITRGGLTGTYNVANNAFNPLLTDFAIGKCANHIFNGNVQLGSQAEINAFNNQYTVITGKLQVFGNTAKNLAPLSRIDTVRGKLEILTTDSLTNLDSLHIRYVGSNVYLEDNKSLQNINGLQTLKYIGKDLVILNCDRLKSLDGLSSLDSIAGSLYIGTEAWKTPPGIKGNDSLVSLCGLKNVIVNNGLVGSYNVANNGYNPLKADYALNLCDKPAAPNTVNNTVRNNEYRVYTRGNAFVIETGNTPVRHISLHNMNGQVVYSQSLAGHTGNVYTIDQTSFSAGLYILVIKGEHTTDRIKVLK